MQLVSLIYTLHLANLIQKKNIIYSDDESEDDESEDDEKEDLSLSYHVCIHV